MAAVQRHHSRSSPRVSACAVALALSLVLSCNTAAVDTPKDVSPDAAAEPDASTRLDLYREIEAYVIDEAIAVPLLWSNNIARATMQPWIHGYERPKYHGSRFVDVWIDRAHPDFEPLGG